MVKPELKKRAALIGSLATDLDWMTSQTISDETPEDLREISVQMTDIICEMIGCLGRREYVKGMALHEIYRETNVKIMKYCLACMEADGTRVDITEDHCDSSKMPRSPHGDSSYGSDD
jgi:hypothetical protein